MAKKKPKSKTGIDKTRPVNLYVDRAGDSVLFNFVEGDEVLQIGVPWPVAQQWAETVLACVADIRDVEAFMITMGTEKTIVHKGKR